VIVRHACPDCDHTWNGEGDVDEVTCPECGTEIDISGHRRKDGYQPFEDDTNRPRKRE